MVNRLDQIRYEDEQLRAEVALVQAGDGPLRADPWAMAWLNIDGRMVKITGRQVAVLNEVLRGAFADLGLDREMQEKVRPLTARRLRRWPSADGNDFAWHAVIRPQSRRTSVLGFRSWQFLRRAEGHEHSGPAGHFTGRAEKPDPRGTRPTAPTMKVPWPGSAACTSARPTQIRRKATERQIEVMAYRPMVSLSSSPAWREHQQLVNAALPGRDAAFREAAARWAEECD